VLQCVAVCYSALQRAAVCCSVLQCAVFYCSVLQCATAEHTHTQGVEEQAPRVVSAKEGKGGGGFGGKARRGGAFALGIAPSGVAGYRIVTKCPALESAQQRQILKSQLSSGFAYRKQTFENFHRWRVPRALVYAATTNFEKSAL